MKETALLMRGEMVRPTLADEKTQTRRLIGKLIGFGAVRQFGVSDTPGYDFHFRDKKMRWHDLTRDEVMKACPYGGVGDQLWIKETWQYANYFGQEGPQNGVLAQPIYRATFPPSVDERHDAGMIQPPKKWRPSIFMPKWACRLNLLNVEIRIERLNDISEADAFAEGIDTEGDDYLSAEHAQIAGVPIDCGSPARFAYKALWERINGRGSWDLNPWVWVIKYRRIDENNIKITG